ncbi:polysaccharide pyruvyl transferase family protein [Parafrigoribacterium soli]|uniref:polysaccharide pyruvyl transferase family protein n=1 Tax=Parafrigoribacterium soli TaxID=3144663 RepID=UPI0032EC800C
MSETSLSLGPEHPVPTPTTPKRVLVLWADDSSPNLGVRVLGRGTAAIIDGVWPGAEVVFQNYGHRAPQLPFGRLRSLAKERVTGTLGMQRWLAGHDLVIDTRSGDSFADIYGLRRLATMSAVAELASQAGVPVVLGPQTIGPFGGRAARTLARRSLRRASLVMARDSASADCAAELGRPVDVLTTDAVFALPVPTVDKTRDVVLNVSGLLWNENPHVAAAHYREVVTRLHRRLSSFGRRITLLAHVIDASAADTDVRAAEEFARMVAPDAEIIIPADLDQVREVVGSARLVIGSRMHACLNALSVGTPAIPLAYSRKFEPLMRDLGWHHTVQLNDDDPVQRVLRELTSPGLPAAVRDVVDRAHHSLESAREALAAL